MGNPAKEGKWSWSDKLAVALACLAAVMALILFWLGKTPLACGISVGAIAALVIYPIAHFASSWKARMPVAAIVFALIALFGWRVWPKNTTPESTDLPMTKASSPQQVETIRREKPVVAPPQLRHPQPAAMSPVQAPGSITQSNSGGINIQQGTTGPNSSIVNSPITLGNIPRTISPEDMNINTSLLKEAKAKSNIEIVADQISGSEPLPDKFYQLFSQSDWAMDGAGVKHITLFSAGSGTIYQGAFIHIYGEPLNTNDIVYEDSPFYYVLTVLQRLNIPYRIDRDKDQSPGLITVTFVGGFPKPQL